MREVAVDVDCDAMQRHPALDPDADRRDLVLAPQLRAAHPDADAVVAPLAGHGEGGEGTDDPFFQRGDEAADVGTAAAQVEHHIGDALARAVIGEATAASSLMHR